MDKIKVFWGILFLLVAFISPCWATTYHIDYNAANDSGAATKIDPWKRAPGMVGFAGSYSHSAGDRFIFKGGVTWPSAALPLTISNSGTSGSQDYYGVDATWYNGGSWTRPIFDLELASGKYNAVYVNSDVIYVDVDNIEMKRLYINDNSAARSLFYADGLSTGVVLKNAYVHYWTRGSGMTTDVSQTAGGVTTYNGWGFTVQDSTIDNSEGCTDCGALIFSCGSALRNTISYAPQGINGCGVVVGNDVSYMTNCFDVDSHENGIYIKGGGSVVAYNTVNVRPDNSTVHGTMIYLDPSWAAGDLYVYGNLFYNMSNQVVVFQNERPDINPSGHIYFWNNTIVLPGAEPCGRASGDIHHLDLKNNHCITVEPDGYPFWYNGHRGEGNVTELSEDPTPLLQSITQATSAGYTESNKYAPTSVSAPTVNTGTSITCPSCDPVIAQDILAISRPQGASWDIGAYEYGSGDTTAPVVTITVPTSEVTYTTSSSPFYLGGTASDATGVTAVTYSNSLGGSGSCTGTTTWSCPAITMTVGGNVITITATDAASNNGTDLITVTYVKKKTLFRR